MNIDKIINKNLEEENKVLKKLIKTLLRDYIGDLCFISNKKLELGLGDCFNKFLEILLKQRINELDPDYSKLLDDRGVDPTFYKELLCKLKDPIKKLK